MWNYTSNFITLAKVDKLATFAAARSNCGLLRRTISITLIPYPYWYYFKENYPVEATMVLQLALLFAFFITTNALRCKQVASSMGICKLAQRKSFSLSASAHETANGGILSLTTAAQRKLSVLFLGSIFCVVSPSTPAHAIDPSSLKQYTLTPGAGIDPSQLKKYTEVQDTLDAADIEYTMLKSGTSYREFREGRPVGILVFSNHQF